MVGLSTAWFLQDRGVEVLVADRATVAAGASWGNAGWIAPALAAPLNEPGVLRHALRTLVEGSSALYLPPTVDPTLWRFLGGFARRCSTRRWRQAMSAYAPVNALAMDAYDELAAGGVAARTQVAPITAVFRRAVDSDGLRRELDELDRSGLDVRTQTLDGANLRIELPLIAENFVTAIRISGQRYLDPGRFLTALADSLVARGGRVRSGAAARAIRATHGGLLVEMFGGEPIHADAVVIATGAWLPELGRRYGLRMPLVAGRGYSFSVPLGHQVSGPVYFPQERIACTPIGGRLRIAGTMEFRGADAPVDTRRVDAMTRAARPLLPGVSWDERSDVWVGSRPVTADGMPVVGATRDSGVYLAGGHGMHGIGLGPITGKLLADAIVTGRTPTVLRPFEPLR